MTRGRRFYLVLSLILTLSLVFCATFGGFAANSRATKVAKQTIKAGSVGELAAKAPLYCRASTFSKTIKYLPKGTKVAVLNTYKTMAKVRLADEKTGYVRLICIKVHPGAKPVAKPEVSLTISAASSLTDVLMEIEKLYEADNPNVALTMNYGSSGSLARQICQGAPVDVFISAANKQMDDLEKDKLLVENSRKVLLKNGLVLIAPKDSDKVKGFDSLTTDGVKLIACGEPESVPAGKYTRESLAKLGLWDKIQSKLVFAKDARQLLTYIESNNADAGFVYTTDARISDKVKVVLTVDEKSHSPIVYPGAVIASSKSQATSQDFLNYLSGVKARSVFEKYGFIVGE